MIAVVYLLVYKYLLHAAKYAIGPTPAHTRKTSIFFSNSHVSRWQPRVSSHFQSRLLRHMGS